MSGTGGKALKAMHHRSQTYKENASQCTVEVRGFDPAKQELYLLYFENPKRGGGSVRELRMTDDAQLMLITFEEPEVARHVASMTHTVGGRVLDVTLASKEKPCTVKVTGGDLELEELYTMYFENRRKGGGAIRDVAVDRNLQAMFITFEDPAVAEAVCKTSHNIRGRNLQVTLHNLQVSNRYETTTAEAQHHPYRLLFQNISDSTTRESLELYLERICGLVPQDILYDDDLDGVLVSFDQALDFARVQEMCHKKSLEGKFLTVSEAPVANSPTTTRTADTMYQHQESGRGFGCHAKQEESAHAAFRRYAPDADHEGFQRLPELMSDTVLVSNLKPSTTTDCISVFFQNKKRNAGGPITALEKLDETTALISFKNPEDAKSVVNKWNHILDGYHLQVTHHHHPPWPFDSEAAAGRRGLTSSPSQFSSQMIRKPYTSEDPETEFPNAEGGYGCDDSGASPVRYSNPRDHPVSHRETKCQGKSAKATPRQKTVKLGSQVIDIITADSGKLRELATYLRQSVDGKFKWKRPDHIVVTASQSNTITNWELKVEEALERFVQPIKMALTQC